MEEKAQKAEPTYQETMLELVRIQTKALQSMKENIRFITVVLAISIILFLIDLFMKIMGI